MYNVIKQEIFSKLYVTCIVNSDLHKVLKITVTFITNCFEKKK